VNELVDLGERPVRGDKKLLVLGKLRRIAKINSLHDLRDIAPAGTQFAGRRRERLAVLDAERGPQVDRRAHEAAQQVGLPEPEAGASLLEPREILRRKVRLDPMFGDVGLARSGHGDPERLTERALLSLLYVIEYSRNRYLVKPGKTLSAY
jgi:hypothetical protein